MSYNYFVATLPTLQIDVESVPYTVEEFLGLCKEHLSSVDYKELTTLMSDREGGSVFSKKWRDADTQIRNAIVLARASKLGVADASKWMHEHDGFDVYIESAVHAAFTGGTNPSEREKQIDALYWNIIEELVGTDDFSLECVLAYALKLRICEKRVKARDKVKGAELLEATVNGTFGK